MRHFILSTLLLLVGSTGSAQQAKSIHWLEDSLHDASAVSPSLRIPDSPLLRFPPAPPLSHRVFGYHPYWAAADDHLRYDYSALTTIGYFSMVVDTETGAFSTLRQWRTTPLIAYAHQRGVKVVLVVTNFGYAANDEILGNPAKGSALITAIVNEVKNAGGDGVNIDFEQVRGSQRANLVAFMRDLAAAMRTVVPGAEVSMATPAVDWSNAFDLAELSTICDYLILMGYDYHWSSAPTAGPVAPLGGENYNVTRSVDTYLAAGVPPNKLLLGVPWYGYDWPVSDTTRMAATTGTGRAVTYRNAEPTAQSLGKLFDVPTGTAWYRYAVDSVHHQVWYDDSLSLALKYLLAKSRGLGGIGIWALSYEGGRAEIWNGIREAFGVPSSVEVTADVEAESRIYPNPVDDRVRVELPANGSAQTMLSLVDALGREVWREEVPTGKSVVVIDTRELPEGAYLLVASGDSFRQSTRLVIVR